MGDFWSYMCANERLNCQESTTSTNLKPCNKDILPKQRALAATSWPWVRKKPATPSFPSAFRSKQPEDFHTDSQSRAPIVMSLHAIGPLENLQRTGTDGIAHPLDTRAAPNHHACLCQHTNALCCCFCQYLADRRGLSVSRPLVHAEICQKAGPDFQLHASSYFWSRGKKRKRTSAWDMGKPSSNIGSVKLKWSSYSAKSCSLRQNRPLRVVERMNTICKKTLLYTECSLKIY